MRLEPALVVNTKKSETGRGKRGPKGLRRACELHEQHRAICEALGDRAGVAHTHRQ